MDTIHAFSFQQTTTKNHDPVAAEFSSHMTNLLKIAQHNTSTGQKKTQTKIDEELFNVNDQVMLSTEHIQTTQPSTKFKHRFTGPFTTTTKSCLP